MSLAVRVIPCLDVDGGRVVKGVNFQGLRDAGDPVELAKRYDAEGADELTFLDISASHEGRASTLRMPPPTVSGMKTSSAVRDTISNVVARPSCAAEMSRKVSSSAPAAS